MILFPPMEDLKLIRNFQFFQEPENSLGTRLFKPRFLNCILKNFVQIVTYQYSFTVGAAGAGAGAGAEEGSEAIFKVFTIRLR